MKVIIAGSRAITDKALVMQVVQDSNFDITEVVSGKCRGVDRLGELIADDLNVPVTPFPADWNTWGPAAGPIRNAQMASYADALVAVLDRESRGTRDMIKQARKKGLAVFVRTVE